MCHRAREKASRHRDLGASNAASKERKRKWRTANPTAGKEWYAVHKEQERARCKKKADSPDYRARRSAYGKQYYQQNRTRHRLVCQAWYEKNKERVAEYSRQWVQRNLPKLNERSRRRRALKMHRTVVPFTNEDLDARMSVFGHCCVYCGGPFEEVDHAIPLARGGYHCLANLRPACRTCNRRKWAKPLHLWLSEVA